MTIQLDQLTFDFNPARSATKQLRFVRAAGSSSTAAEESTTSFVADDFVVVYARRDERAPEIRLKLSSPDLSVDRADIQALADEGNVLGNVSPTSVSFDGTGSSKEVIISFPNSTLGKGVQCNTVKWEWQFRKHEKEHWVPFQTTQHRVYCIFSQPTDPWETTPLSEDVLKYACAWANGAQEEVPAATAITEAVFNLGVQRRVTYTDAATYAKDRFDYEWFLDFLCNGVGTSQSLNCDDCATIVSTFGNILGCDLHQSEMGSYFQTNFVRLIGQDGWVRPTFDRHAVAWKDDCTTHNPLYDACLQIDADGCPNEPEHQPRQPTNLRFGSGSPADNDYKFCLVSATTSNPCTPNPQFKKRRLLGKSYFAQNRFTDASYLKVLADRYNLESVSDDPAIAIVTPQPSLENFVATHEAFRGWKGLQADKFKDDHLDAAEEITLLFPEKDPSQMVRLNVYICAEHTSAKDFLLQILAQFNSSATIRRQESDLAGAVVFAQRDQTMHVVKYHQLIGLVRSVGRKSLSTTKMAKAIEDYLAHLRSNDVSSSSLTTSTSPKSKDQPTTGESNMAHILATNWTCHLRYPASADGLAQRGTMDLKDMGEDGKITTGRYYLPAGGHNTLRGEATGGSPVFHLVLREYNAESRLIATYEATLVYANNDKSVLVMAGKRHSEISPNSLEAAVDQADSPWVITKP